MTFLNAILLFGLAVVAIPIIIHILNRRRAQIVDWGAMRFLEESLASRNRRILIEEILLMALRCLLLGLLVFALARPRVITGRLLAGDAKDPQDVAIVLDASLSMNLAPQGKSNFQRALEEARQVLRACRRGDAAAVILAGSTAEAVVPSPLSDLEEVARRLEGLGPMGGSLAVVEALHAAILALREGGNPVKKIVLITDGQQLGWDLTRRQRWQFLAEAAATSALPAKPLIVVRTLDPPEQWRNLSAAGIRFSRAVVGTDRSVKVQVTVANTGLGALAPQRVELIVDGEVTDHRKGEEVAEGASATVEFAHRFDAPGPHVVAARVVCEDDLPQDNEALRVLDVRRELPVLIVQGRPSPLPMTDAADYLTLALAPPAPEPEAPPETRPRNAHEPLLRPTVVPAADIGKVSDFSDYAVVILAGAPRLPQPAAEALGRYVHAGGGLLVAPGPDADRAAYEAWKAIDEQGVIGCRLAEFRRGGPGDARFVHVAANTLDHPALRLAADPAESDLASAEIHGRWSLVPSDGAEVSVGAYLDSGEPFLVQRKLGKGFVLTLSVPLDRDASDLPVRDCYVPLVHEAVYYLAAPAQRPMNLQPGQQIVLELPPGVSPPEVVEVVGPDGRRSPAALGRRGQQWQATYARTARVGLYRLMLPQRPGAPAKPAAPAPVETAPAAAPPANEVPFVVLSDPKESSLETLPVEAYAQAAEFVNLARATTRSELTAAIRGGAPGREIWKYVALALVALLVGEIVATRAITAHRQAHVAAPIAFGVDQQSAEAFRAASPEAPEAQKVS